MPDVLLLELDGVLLDDAAIRLCALREALREALGEPAVGDAELAERAALHAIGPAAAAAASHVAPLDPTARDLVALRAEQAYERRLATGVTLLDGALRFLQHASAGARLALVTGAPRRRAESMLALAGLADYFATIVTADDVLDPKPAPEAHRAALARLARRAPVRRAVALEGTRDGIRAARAAGVAVLAVGPLPSHVALEADGALPTLDGVTLADVARLAGADAGAGREGR